MFTLSPVKRGARPRTLLTPLAHPQPLGNKMEFSKPSDFPPRLYKRIPAQYMEVLLTKGELQIGHLYGYRSQPHAEPGVEDQGEGKRDTLVDYCRVENVGRGLPPALENVFPAEPGATGTLTIQDCHVVEQSPDFFMVSTSLTLEGAKAISDTGIVILDPLGFGRAITEHLANLNLAFRGRFIADECRYTSRHHEDWRAVARAPITMVKEPRFHTQTEFRYLWFPQPGVTPRFMIEQVPGLKDLIAPW